MSPTDILTYVVILLLALACYYLRAWFRCALVVSNLPGPPALPILGHAHFATDNKILRDLGSSCHRVYGPLMKLWLALYPAVLVISPHCLQKILSSTKQTEKLFFYKLMDNFLGKGLVTSSGSTWRLHRKLLQPSFSQSVLEQFIPAFHDGSQRLVKRFQDHGAAPVNITSHMNQAVLDILNDTILGVQADDTVHLKADENSPFRNAKVLIPYRISHPWLLVDWIYKSTEASKQENDHRRNLSEFAREVIQKRKAERESNEKANNNPENGSQKTRISLLDRMLDISDNNPDFDEEAIIDEVCTFMLAGQESVATAMSFCLFLLARHQDALRKVRDEVHAIFGSSQRVPTLHDLRQMRYLEQCIKEALRLYPSLPLLGRRLSESVNMGKCTLPAGCGVLISPYATHRIAEIFPDPEKFDPDRFLPENVQNMHPYAYNAFSLGPRNCIGKAFAIMEMKTLLSALVRRYHVSTVPGKEDIELAYRITLRAKGGLWVQFSPHHTADAQPS